MFLPRINSAVLTIIAGDILLLIAGMSFSWSSPVLPKLTNNTATPFGRNLSYEEATWISSLLPLGAAVGPFLVSYISDRIGRKYTLLALGLPILLSYIIMAYGTIVELFYFSRFLIGFAVGGIMVIMPNYCGEMAEKSVRGILSSTQGCAITLGNLFSLSVGPYVKIRTFSTILAIFPAVFILVFFVVGKESPRYYVSKGDIKKAEEVVKKLRGKTSVEAIEEEVSDIRKKIAEENDGSFLDVVMSRGMIKAFVTTAGLLLFQQLSGINLIFYYSQTIFEVVGAALPAEICAIMIGVAQFLSSFTTPLIIDRYGRVTSLIASSIGIIVSEIPLGIYIFLQDQGTDVSSASFVPILALAVFIFSYNSGFGTIPWIMLGEVFPVRTKAIGTSVVTCMNWTLSFLSIKYFPFFVNTIGLAQSFWIFASCCFLAILFCKFYVIETKGKSLEEIQTILRS